MVCVIQAKALAESIRLGIMAVFLVMGAMLGKKHCYQHSLYPGSIMGNGNLKFQLDYMAYQSRYL